MDIWSLSMTMIELFIEVRPFDHIRRESAVLYQIITNEARPARPVGNQWVGESMWALLNECWQTEPTERPDIDAVIARTAKIQECRLQVRALCPFLGAEELFTDVSIPSSCSQYSCS